VSALRVSYDKYFETEIAAIREQVRSVKAERDKGTVAIEKKVEELESARQQFDTIEEQLSGLISSLAVGLPPSPADEATNVIKRK
jgi:hypothetical protein